MSFKNNSSIHVSVFNKTIKILLTKVKDMSLSLMPKANIALLILCDIIHTTTAGDI